MADDCGRVNPVTPQFLNRDDRKDLYRGRRMKKHPVRIRDGSGTDEDGITVEDAGEPESGNRIDLRI